MPVWWGKKFIKSRQKHRGNHLSGSENGSEHKNDAVLSDLCKPLTTSGRDLSSSPMNRSGSGFSGFDSDGGGGGGGGGGDGDRTPFPLPRPFLSPSPANCSDHGARLGSGSVSVSSSSSSGSFEDSHFALYRGNAEGRSSMRCKSPCLRSRGPSSGTSPLHPRVCGSSLGSLSERGEDGRSHGHPLPLPPGSPTSPPTTTTARTNGVGEYLNNTTLSRWKKGRLLGRGTFGHVYLGFNSESGHMCAIKEVKVVSDDQTSKECLKQLNQEIVLLSQLSHPNIVRYYGSDLGEDSLSVYLEYVSGGSINKLLHEYGPFKEPVVQNYTRQILSGLAYLHGRNTVHRDIKGANILVDPNGEIKLADFGMAKHITSTSSVLSFKGSPYWMAPEVVMNANGYNLAVDIWSLGCTILEMVTSKPPWSHYEGVAAIFKIGNSKDIPEIPEHLSAEAKSFLQLCLQRDPEARPPAVQLLDHAFVRDGPTNRPSFSNTCRDPSPSPIDGSTPSSCDLLPDRIFLPSADRDSLRPLNIFSGNSRSSRIMSLPVSPCSSPLHKQGPAYRSCYLSPPRSTFATPVYHSHILDADHLFGPWRDTSSRYSRTFDRNV